MSDQASPSISPRPSTSSPRPIGRTAFGPLLAAAAAAGIVSLAHDAQATDVEISFTEVPGATAYRLYYDNDGPDPPYEGYQAEEGFSPYEVQVSDMPDPAAPSISLTGMP